jgi:glycosyltransferase involved in cell wall biosynthesis
LIVAMLRVKNEARWIAEVLDALKPCCERLFVMNNHSTDNTGDIARECGATVYDSPLTGPLNEAAEKDWLLRKVEAECPSGTSILCVDGDEVLEPSGPDKVRALAQSYNADAYQFRILYLWDDREHVRTDGVYGKFYRPSMFRLRPGLSFKRTGAHANFHCSSVPAQYIAPGRCATSDVALLHLGYMDREDRIRKWKWYCSKDGANSVEDGYKHIVIGDVFPADSVFKWAGPLKIEALG